MGLEWDAEEMIEFINRPNGVDKEEDAGQEIVIVVVIIIGKILENQRPGRRRIFMVSESDQMWGGMRYLWCQWDST